MKKIIKIGHLYPKLLNIYGDIGNIITLKKRCEWRGIECIVEEINIGDNFREHDIYFIGGGQDTQQVEVSNELQKHKEFLKSEAERGAVFLGICGGYQLLGNYYKPHEGRELKGIGLLDAYTIAGDKRFIGNVTVKSEIVKSGTLVGFENHSGLTYLQGDTKPIGIILTGYGNNGTDKSEGAQYKNVFGTYLHGAFLPKNPEFADYMLEIAVGEKLPPINNSIENSTHNALINKAY